MEKEFFDNVLLIKEGQKRSLDIRVTPFFCNLDGAPKYLPKVPSDIKELAPTLSTEVMGTKYNVLADPTICPADTFGDQTYLRFDVETVAFEALAATTETAAAFGMTLIKPGQAIQLNSPQPLLSVVDFEYGMFAGFRSPYDGTGYQITSKVCTDLEYHDFPHLFASIHPKLPRVTSVARYWPERKEIFLADLWVPPGSALYIPPRPTGSPFFDLHCSRNSALACWHGTCSTSLPTQTLLQTEDIQIHWFWNERPTIHPLLDIHRTA